MSDFDNDRLMILRKRAMSFKGQKVQVIPEGIRGAIIGLMNKVLQTRELRMEVIQWLFNDPFLLSSSELEDWQWFVLYDWVKPAKLVEGSPWTSDPQFSKDCFLWRTQHLLRQENQNEVHQ